MKLLRTFLLLFISLQLSESFAQEILYSHSKDEVVATEGRNGVSENAKKDTNKQSKIDYSVSMGTGISTSNFGNALNVFAEPELRYRLSPKWSISTGFILINSSISGLYSDFYGGKKNITNSYITAAVNYQATERLRVKGEILYGMNKSPFGFGDNRNQAAHAVRFSAEYKISEKFRFGVQIMHSNNTFSPFNYGDGLFPMRNNNMRDAFFMW